MLTGIINVYKEAGYTSFDVVALLRGITRQKKVGHTGTLDPDAIGVLPVCFGQATKLCGYLTEKTKEYVATFVLGIETDTQDISGTVLQENTVNITRDNLCECIMGFVGKQKQIPPMYSALKVDGKKLYELAREGKTIPRTPRDIEIFNIEIIDIDMDKHTAAIRVTCSKGTYIRTLCHDIGRKLGCGAAMTSLVRTRSGEFCIEQAYTVSQIEKMLSDIPCDIEIPCKNPNAKRLVRDAQKVSEALKSITIPIDKAFGEYEAISVDGEELSRVLNGNYIKRAFSCDVIRVYDANQSFLAIYEYDSAREVYKPQKMFCSRDVK